MMKRVIFLVTMVSLAATPAVADNLILGVPDWDQPNAYAVATAGLNAGDYPSWCSPTAGAGLMGYWEDQIGLVGLTDRVSPGSVPFTNLPNANTFMQGLWHDGTIEMGWFMDTGSWSTNNGPFPPLVGLTNLNNIGNAIVYAATAWADPGGLSKVGYVNASTTMDRWNNGWNAANFQVMWDNYTAEIDAGRPALVSFDGWVVNHMGDVIVMQQNVEQWDIASGMGHTVVGVGYIDTDTANLGDEWFITQDNQGFTGQYVAVALNWHDTLWRQNDYFTIPEPATVSLVMLGLVALVAKRRK